MHLPPYSAPVLRPSQSSPTRCRLKLAQRLAVLRFQALALWEHDPNLVGPPPRKETRRVGLKGFLAAPWKTSI